MRGWGCLHPLGGLSAQRPLLTSCCHPPPCLRGPVSAPGLNSCGLLTAPGRRGGEGPRERRGNPQGAAGPSCVPALFPAQHGRVAWSLICRVWRRTSARTSEVPRQPAPGCGQVPEQPRSGREASLGKPPVPLEEALSCRAVPHLQQPARRVLRSSLGIGVGRWRGPPPSLQS